MGCLCPKSKIKIIHSKISEGDITHKQLVHSYIQQESIRNEKAKVHNEFLPSEIVIKVDKVKTLIKETPKIYNTSQITKIDLDKFSEKLTLNVVRKNIPKEQNSPSRSRPNSILLNQNFDQMNNSILKLRELNDSARSPTATPKKYVHFVAEHVLNSKLFMQDLPITGIWLESEKEVHFCVSGKISLFKEGRLINCLGDLVNEAKINNFNIGALLGYIPGCEIFNICDSLKYIPQYSGPLYIFINLDINTSHDYSPEGEFKIQIKDLNKFSEEDIESKSEWNLSKLNTYAFDNHEFFTENEIKHLILLNKLRSNPKLFSKHYLHRLKWIDKYQHIYEQLSNYEEEPIQILKPSKKLKLICLEIEQLYQENELHSIDLNSSIISNNLKEKAIINIDIFIETYFTDRNQPIQDIINFISSTQISNNNFFKREMNYVGISIINSPSKGWYCIYVFSEQLF
jgi:hypothetical protein